MENDTREQRQTSANSNVSVFLHETNEADKCHVVSYSSDKSCVTGLESVSVIKESSKKSEPLKGKFRLPEHILFKKGQPIPYECTACGKTFKSKSNCCYHKHCANVAEKPHICTVCNRRFSTKTHFKYHSLMHTGLNPFKCTQCSKSFKTKHKLARHEAIHSDKVKNFPCDLCGRVFLREASVKVHKRSHSGGKTFRCSECPKTFREKRNLMFHLSSHRDTKDWICEVCGKAYAIKWNLELHKRTHTRVRPFQCPVAKCQQSFSQNRYLKRHMETHKNSIKFVCSICEKVFSRRDNLQRHVVNTHLEYQTQSMPKNDRANRLGNDGTVNANTMPKSSKNNEYSKDIVPHRSVSAVRESVIKSIATSPEIVPRTNAVENTSNYVSVIKRTDDVNYYDASGSSKLYNGADMHDRNSTQVTVSFNIEQQSTEFGNPAFCSADRWSHHENDADDLPQNGLDVHGRPSSPQYIYLNNITTDPGDLIPQFEDVDCVYSGTVHCQLRSNVINHTSEIPADKELQNTIIQECSSVLPARPRCLLPKKVIAASYTNCSFSTHKDLELEDTTYEPDRHSGIPGRWYEGHNLLDLSLKSQE